jgi:hypothetical protein
MLLALFMLHKMAAMNFKTYLDGYGFYGLVTLIFCVKPRPMFSRITRDKILGQCISTYGTNIIQYFNRTLLFLSS